MSCPGNRYVCNLSPTVLAKAVSELHEPEDNDKRLTFIDELRRNFQQNSEGLTLISEDDAFLLRFLRARKFDMQRALAMLISYHKQRISWKEVFDKVCDPESLSKVFDAGCVCGSIGRAKDGSAVIVGRPGKLPGMKLHEFFAALFLSVETLLENEDIQVHGITVIQDMQYLNFGFIRQLGPSVASRFLGILQDCLPLRLKSLNLLNEPMVFDVLFAIIGPFIKEKTKKRLTIHGNEFDGLLNIIDADVLPTAYNGSGGELNIQAWKDEVMRRSTNMPK